MVVVVVMVVRGGGWGVIWLDGEGCVGLCKMWWICVGWEW